MKESHSNFNVSDSGLRINTQKPCIRATPDGTTSCTYCVVAIVAIKYPYCHRGLNIKDAAEDKKFCLYKKDWMASYIWIICMVINTKFSSLPM